MPQLPFDFQPLKASRICMLGFGAQGEAEAVNLRKSGVPFYLGLRSGGASAKRATELGFEVRSMPAALDDADTVIMNLPDQVQAGVYNELLTSRPQIQRLIFAHGFNTHFKLIPVLEKAPRHILVAPKGAASGLQEFYGTPNALPAILAQQPTTPTPSEKTWIETFALAVGAHPKALIWADFKDETVCDLFSEQVLLCGGVSQLLQSSYEVMVEAGYDSNTAYFESLFELKLIVDLIWKRGITGMRAKISPTARYGDLTRGPRVIDASVKKKMKEVLTEIENGSFAKEFLEKIQSKEFKDLLAKQAQHPIELRGAELRKKMAE